MKKINAEIVKNIISTTIAFTTLIILALAIITGSRKDKVDGLQGGDIQQAIDTGQFR